MSDEQQSQSATARVHLGILVVLLIGGLTFLRWQAAAGPLETLADFERQRDAGQVNDAGWASAQYHAAHARDEQATRWRVSGYATQGLLGALIGLGLIVSGRRGRPA
jgi:hypothetical protein